MSTTEVRSPSVTHWQKERDGLLDQIGFLANKIDSAENYLLRFEEQHPEVAYEIGELYLILSETRIDYDMRRGFDQQPADVLVSVGTETKEEQI